MVIGFCNGFLGHANNIYSFLARFLILTSFQKHHDSICHKHDLHPHIFMWQVYLICICDMLSRVYASWSTFFFFNMLNSFLQAKHVFLLISFFFSLALHHLKQIQKIFKYHLCVFLNFVNFFKTSIKIKFIDCLTSNHINKEICTNKNHIYK